LNVRVLQPPTWPRPKGYANGVAARGLQVFVSGQVGWNEQGAFDALDFVGQTRQALRNVIAVLAEAGARPEHVVRMTWYVVDKQEYLAAGRELGGVYREFFGRHYPAMTAVEVAGLIEDRARVEIEVTAVLPE
jgi:enamine deaminase RidA (YjgF/YER057c/UK114 family)